MLHLLSQASLLVSYSAPTRIGGIFGFSCERQVLFLEVTSYNFLLMAGLFSEILDTGIKEISDLSKLPKSPGRGRRKASTSKSIFLFFKNPKPDA